MVDKREFEERFCYKNSIRKVGTRFYLNIWNYGTCPAAGGLAAAAGYQYRAIAPAEANRLQRWGVGKPPYATLLVRGTALFWVATNLWQSLCIRQIWKALKIWPTNQRLCVEISTFLL